MRFLFDTNVVLDVLLAREPHWKPASVLFTHVDTKQLEGCLAATTITTIEYLAAKALGRRDARKHVASLLEMFHIAPVDRRVLEDSVSSRFDNFEDALVYHAGLQAGATGIVTRDRDGFRRADIAVYDPEEALVALRATSERGD